MKKGLKIFLFATAGLATLGGARQGYYAYRANRDRNAAKPQEILQEAPKPLDNNIDALEKSKQRSAIPVN